MMGGWGYDSLQNDTALDWQSTLFRKSRKNRNFRSPQEVREMIDKALERATIDKRFGAEEARAAAAFIYLFDLPGKKKAIAALKRIMLNSKWIASWRSMNKIVTALVKQIETLGGKVTKVEIKEVKAKADSKKEKTSGRYISST